MATNTITMFAPDGSTGEIPADKVASAQQAGFKRAYSMVTPDGKTSGYVPEDRANDAAKAGFRLGTVDKSPIPEAYGFTPGNIVSNVGAGLAGIAKGGVQLVRDVGGVVLPQSLGGDPLNNLGLVHHIVDPMRAQGQQAATAFQQSAPLSLHPTPEQLSQRQLALGHGLAAAIPVIGPWAAGLGEQAGTGDVGGALAQGTTQILAPKVAQTGLGLLGRAAVKAGVPQAMYESALKQSTTLSPAQRAANVETGLKSAIPISKGGVEKLGDLVDDLNQKIKDTIAADPTRPIDPNAVAARTAQTEARFANQVNPEADLNAIQAAQEEFLRRQGATPTTPAPPMTAEAAQAMKQGTYQQLKGKAYGELKTASIEAQKTLARGLKEEIATQFPEISDLNARESQLLGLQPVLERAVNRIGNHQLVGLGTPVVAAAGEAITHSPKIAMAVGAMKMVLDQPMVKSRLAIAISKASKIPIGQAMGKVNAYSASLGAYGATPGGESGDSSTNPTNQAPQ